MGVGIAISSIAYGFGASVSTAIGLGFSAWRAYGSYQKAKELEASASTYGFGQTSNTKSQEIPIPIIYGQNMVAGNIIYERVEGEDDGKMYAQIGIGQGPIHAINDIKANDQLMAGKDDMSVSYKTGNRTQTANSMNLEGQTFPYLAYISAYLEADEQINGTPTFTSIVEGRTVDVWTGADWINEYSRNPAWGLLDLLINDRYGLGIDKSNIDKESFKTVADYADELVNGEPRFRLDYVIDTEQSSLDVIEDILGTFRSYLIYSGGQLKLKADKQDNIVQAFDMDNIVMDSFNYSKSSIKDRPNKVMVQYIDPDENWEKIYAQYSDDGNIAKKNKIKKETITLLGINRFSQAGRLARYYLNKKKYCNTFVEFNAGIDSLHCEVGDVISVSHDVPGWVEKDFRVLEISEDEKDEMHIVGQEYNEAIYDDTEIPKQTTKDSTLPNPFEAPPQIDSTTIALTEIKEAAKDGTFHSKVLVEWDKPANPYFKYTNLYFRESSTTSWNVLESSTTGDSYKTSKLTEGSYDVKLVSESVHNIRANFINAPVKTITVEGKTAPPSDVTLKNTKFVNTIEVSWYHIFDGDLKDYELRLDANFGTDDANLLYRGDNNTIEFGELPLGNEVDTTRSYTLYLKARNNSGLYSATATSVTITNTEPSPPSLNIVEFFEKLWIEVTPPTGEIFNGFEIEVENLDSTAVEVFDISAGERVEYAGPSGTSYNVRARSYDIIGPGAWSTTYSAATKTIDGITQFASSMRPATIVETLPTLPDSSYPPGSYVTLVTRDTGGNITNVELHRNDNDSWTLLTGPDLENGMSVYPRVVAGTIQAGAISTDELAAKAITADEIGANEIITYSANIADAVIDSASIIDVSAEKITVGASTTYEAGYNPYENNKEALKVKPENAKLWHFDKHYTSTQGEIITFV